MTNQRRTVVALLCAIAVLLTLNLMRPVGGDAHAGGVSDGEPYVVDYAPHHNDSTIFYRLWSDGQVDEWAFGYLDCGAQFHGVRVPPVDHTAPAISMGGPNGVERWWIAFADGRLDTYHAPTGTRCVQFGEGDGALCLGDIDRDGMTGMSDLLTTIQDWGCTSE